MLSKPLAGSFLTLGLLSGFAATGGTSWNCCSMGVSCFTAASPAGEADAAADSNKESPDSARQASKRKELLTQLQLMNHPTGAEPAASVPPCCATLAASAEPPTCPGEESACADGDAIEACCK